MHGFFHAIRRLYNLIKLPSFQSSDSDVYKNVPILPKRYSRVQLNCFSVISNTLAVVENHPRDKMYRRESKDVIFIEYYRYILQISCKL